MDQKDITYIIYKPRLFEYVLESPLDQLNTEEQFQQGLTTISRVIDSSSHLVVPTSLSYRIADLNTDSAQEHELNNASGFTADDIVDAVKESAQSVHTPRLVQFRLTGSTHITLADGDHYVGTPEESSVFKVADSTSDEFHAPIDIHIAQSGVMKPCRTEIVTLIANSDHWIETKREGSRTPEVTTLAGLNQTRLEAALSCLYDSIDPLEFSVNLFEDTNGVKTPITDVPDVVRCELVMLSSGLVRISRDTNLVLDTLASNILGTKSIHWSQHQTQRLSATFTLYFPPNSMNPEWQ